jgi:hypothetical protein
VFQNLCCINDEVDVSIVGDWNVGILEKKTKLTKKIVSYVPAMSNIHIRGSSIKNKNIVHK